LYKKIDKILNILCLIYKKSIEIAYKKTSYLQGLFMLSGDKPLYIQIIDSLKEKIKKGEFQPNQRLSTEKELAEGFNVSRIT